ncbi:cyclic nucleotide-binding protein [Emticicia oligotrophica DSM 17448]|uniref:Cyclic nucleotide-binding protein n=1 Tax=Emticicia oligotrophica (strain DSM 17448 / CIP 109782 / MTCC 6937 / GPTSA100-15) TaxID=929562 RepID=A0ABM5N393_EMTOG|nr:cyclic nucleotide-binding protein [Emticicia oligotrophica DSM 17448]
MDISTFLKQQGIYSDSIAEWLHDNSKTKKYSKGHTLLMPGETSQRVYYVQEGLLRSFYTKDDKDITHTFVAEAAFILPIECIFHNAPAIYGYELLENTTITTFRYDDFNKLQQFPEIKEVEKLLLYDAVKRFSDIIHTIKFQSAKERYERMLKEYPNILLRAPLGHIASYLGITQQTLSVIRGQI